MNKHGFLSGIVVALALVSTPALGKRHFRYMLNPLQAEQVLAGIPLNAPMNSQSWLGLLGNKRDDRYTIQPGDSLWSISARTVGNPFLWRKLWAMNPELSNPHDLEIGQMLSYYRDGLPTGGFDIPLIKLRPGRSGAGTDLDSDAVINLDLKNQYRPSFFIVKEEDILGDISGSYVRLEGLTTHDDTYANFGDPSKINENDRFSVVRVLREVHDHTSEGSPRLGMLVRLVGEVKTHQTAQGHTKIELTRHMEVIRRGDKLVAVRDPVKFVSVFNPPEDMVVRLILGDIPDVNYFAAGQIVLLNKGTNDGMKDGYLFRALVDTDPLLKSALEVSPDYKGEVQVLSAGESASVGMIIRSKEPLVLGDTLVAAQLFRDLPPPPRRLTKELELN